MMNGTINFNYQRVVPRDLFNEAKLLKCLAQLSLLVHDNKIHGVHDSPVITCTNTGLAFRVGRHDAGYLLASGVSFFGGDGEKLELFTTYNSREPWPLVVITDDFSEIPVFDNDGQVTADFIDYLKQHPV